MTQNNCTLDKDQCEALFKEIRESLKKLETKIENLESVEIQNGGGRHVSYERSEFFQMLYDNGNWKNIPAKADFWLKFLLALSQLITLIILLAKGN